MIHGSSTAALTKRWSGKRWLSSSAVPIPRLSLKTVVTPVYRNVLANAWRNGRSMVNSNLKFARPTKWPASVSSALVTDSQSPKRNGYARKTVRMSMVGTSSSQPRPLSLAMSLAGSPRGRTSWLARCVRIAMGQASSGGPLEDRLEPLLGLGDGALHVAGAVVLQRLGEHVGHDELGLRLCGLLARRRRPARPLARPHHLLEGLHLGIGVRREEDRVVVERGERARVVAAGDGGVLEVVGLVHQVQEQRLRGVLLGRVRHHRVIEDQVHRERALRAGRHHGVVGHLVE